jgi:hypothetical protein
MLEHLSALHHVRNKHRIDLYVCLCVHPFACMNLPKNETRKWAVQTAALLAVTDDASMAYFLENQWHTNAGQRRQDVLTGYVMGMTIKGPFCCLWIFLRCLQSWLRESSSVSYWTCHTCLLLLFSVLLSYVIIIFILSPCMLLSHILKTNSCTN